MTHSRREVLAAAAGTVFASVLLPLRATAIPQLRATGIELLPVRATSRTVWLIVRLRTDGGLEGLGEASDAFGFANTTAEDTARMRAQLAAFFNLIDGRSPFEILPAARRSDGAPGARRRDRIQRHRAGAVGPGRQSTRRTVACPALRQGQEHSSRLRQHQPRHEPTHAGWLCRGGQTAVADGFRAIKAAPWDGFPPPSSPENAVAPMAGGETLFELSGFAPLVRRRAVDTIMPGVKHCGGLLELTRIAAMAADEGVMVAPHNPRR